MRDTATMRRHRAVPIFVGIVVVGVLGACSAKGSSSASAPSTTTRPTTSTSGSSAGRSLASLSDAASDLGAGEHEGLMEDGDDAVGSVTLDWCGFDFTTEAHREARRQVVIGNSSTDYVASIEVVRYRPGYAAKALAEMRKAVTTCPPTKPEASRVAGEPTATYVSRSLPDRVLRSVVPAHLAVTATATPTDGSGALHRTFVFQQRGDVLIGVYADAPARAVALANASGRRLAAADPALLAG